MVKPHPIPTDYRFKDLTGDKNGRLTVLFYIGKQPSRLSKADRRYPTWKAHCECGRVHFVTTAGFPRTASCGCIKCPVGKPDFKVCSVCKRDLPFDVTHFKENSQHPFGLTATCRDCRNADNRPYERKRTSQIRLLVLQHYSGKEVPDCACCGESLIEFLTIDHIDGGGHQHRKHLKKVNIYHWLKARGFPSGYRVLCMNCNHSLGVRGYCPHQNVKI